MLLVSADRVFNHFHLVLFMACALPLASSLCEMSIHSVPQKQQQQQQQNRIVAHTSVFKEIHITKLLHVAPQAAPLPSPHRNRAYGNVAYLKSAANGFTSI